MKNRNGLFLLLGVILIGVGIVYYVNFRTVTVSFTQKIGPGLAPLKVRINSTIDEIGAPAETDDYEFLGWYLDGEKFNFNTPITKDINLEAKWKNINKTNDNQM